MVPRLDADALVDALALHVPAGRVPVRRARRRERAARAGAIRSTSWSTPASSTRAATGRSPSTTRRPRPTTCCIRVRSATPAPTQRELDVLPTLWFRNTLVVAHATRRSRRSRERDGALVAEHTELGTMRARRATAPRSRCSARTRRTPSACGACDGPPYPKDGIDDHVVHGAATVNPARTGTKAALRYRLEVAAGRQRSNRGCGSRPKNASSAPTRGRRR